MKEIKSRIDGLRESPQASLLLAGSLLEPPQGVPVSVSSKVDRGDWLFMIKAVNPLSLQIITKSAVTYNG